MLQVIIYLLIIIGVFLVTTLFGYVVHKALHLSWTGRFHKSHLKHHLEVYPIERFMSEKYQGTGKDNNVWIFGIAAIPMLLVPLLFGIFGIISLLKMAVILIVMLLVGAGNTIIHDAFHIENHWLNRFSWFAHWWVLHYQHHKDMKTNLGIFSFFWDKMFGTFSKLYLKDHLKG